MASDRLWGNRDNKIVILDSSALMMLFEFSIDLEKELTRILGNYHIVVPQGIINELEFLIKNGSGKRQRIAKPALKLAKNYDVVKNNEDEMGDDSILTLARKTGGMVLTNDKELKKKLKEIPVHVIFLRSKKKLDIE